MIDPSICENPIAVDARIVKSCLHWTVLGRGAITNNGFVCKNTDPYFLFASFLTENTEQSSAQVSTRYDDGEWDGYLLDDYPCDDYEVRFCCPEGIFLNNFSKYCKTITNIF